MTPPNSAKATTKTTYNQKLTPKLSQLVRALQNQLATMGDLMVTDYDFYFNSNLIIDQFEAIRNVDSSDADVATLHYSEMFERCIVATGLKDGRTRIWFEGRIGDEWLPCEMLVVVYDWNNFFYFGGLNFNVDRARPVSFTTRPGSFSNSVGSYA